MNEYACPSIEDVSIFISTLVDSSFPGRRYYRHRVNSPVRRGDAGPLILSPGGPLFLAYQIHPRANRVLDPKKLLADYQSF